MWSVYSPPCTVHCSLAPLDKWARFCYLTAEPGLACIVRRERSGHHPDPNCVFLFLFPLYRVEVIPSHPHTQIPQLSLAHSAVPIQPALPAFTLHLHLPPPSPRPFCPHTLRKSPHVNGTILRPPRSIEPRSHITSCTAHNTALWCCSSSLLPRDLTFIHLSLCFSVLFHGQVLTIASHHVEIQGTK